MKYFVVGGAGFIGSSYVNRIVSLNPKAEIIVYDNLSSTHNWKYLNWGIARGNVKCVLGDAKDMSFMMSYMKDVDLVAHFASNPDISKAVSDPMIDFRQGTYLTQNIVEAMRLMGIKKIIYASGSGVYGDAKETELWEDYSPMLPVSTYGASKLAGEALICAYCHMFDMQGIAYRFANVIGAKSTHGIILDFVNKLTKDPFHLKILGSGAQNKGYIHIDDILNGIFLTQNSKKTFNYFNIAPDTCITVTKIADIVIEEMALKDVKYEYGEGIGGWKGDIPTVVMDSSKIKLYGWRCSMTSEEAIRKATREMLKERSL